MNIHEATAQYEAWAARHLTLMPADLDLKHALTGAPRVLGVGNLHVENFGTSTQNSDVCRPPLCLLG